MSSIQITGVAETIRVLHGISGAELQKKATKSIAASARAIVVPAMKAEARSASRYSGDHVNAREYPHPAGTLVNSITARKVKPRTADTLVAYSVWPRNRKGSKNRAWYRAMVIAGTKPHMVTARGFGGSGSLGARIARSYNRGGALTLAFGGTLVPMVRHPGARANPFVERAVSNIDANALAARLGKELIK